MFVEHQHRITVTGSHQMDIIPMGLETEILMDMEAIVNGERTKKSRRLGTSGPRDHRSMEIGISSGPEVARIVGQYRLP
jgi:hypothetical protein